MPIKYTSCLRFFACSLTAHAKKEIVIIEYSAHPMYIIGIGHKEGHGKDTYGSILNELIPNSFLGAFAVAPKEKAAEETGDPVEKFNTREGKAEYLEAYGMTRREVLIRVAEDEKKIAGEDIWVNTLFERAEEYIEIEGIDPEKAVLIITDVRFPNEAEAIRKRGGILIKITRPGVPLSNRASEIALDNYDKWTHHVLNDGTVEDLKPKAQSFSVQFQRSIVH